MKITVNQVNDWRPPERYDRLVGVLLEKREGLTPFEIADLDIPLEDRLCALLREEIIPVHELRLLRRKWAFSDDNAKKIRECTLDEGGAARITVPGFRGEFLCKASLQKMQVYAKG